MLPLAAPDANDNEVGATTRLLAVGAACVTAIVRVIPPPLTVTLPVRAAVPVFAVALIVKLLLLVPPVGETLSQLWLSLAVQLTFAVTDTGAVDAAAASDTEV